MAAGFPTPARAPRATAAPQAVPAASAIVLAGGRSSRFGTDKLEVWVGGRPLLEHTLEAAAGASREVVLVTAPKDSVGERKPLARIRGVPIRTVRDDESFGGPLLGMLAGLRAARHPLCIVVGGDMPLVRAELLVVMLRAAREAGDGARSVALRFDDHVQPLPLVLRREVGPAIAALVGQGRRAIRDLLEAMAVRVLEPAEWLPCDPEALSLVDVDRIEDLVHWTGRLIDRTGH